MADEEHDRWWSVRTSVPLVLLLGFGLVVGIVAIVQGFEERTLGFGLLGVGLSGFCGYGLVRLAVTVRRSFHPEGPPMLSDRVLARQSIDRALSLDADVSAEDVPGATKYLGAALWHPWKFVLVVAIAIFNVVDVSLAIARHQPPTGVEILNLPVFMYCVTHLRRQGRLRRWAAKHPLAK